MYIRETSVPLRVPFWFWLRQVMSYALDIQLCHFVAEGGEIPALLDFVGYARILRSA